MAADIVMAAQAPFQNAFSLLEKYMEVCPDPIWQETSGGWPVWQQIYHTLTTLDFFVGSPDDFPMPTPLNPGVGNLSESCPEPMSKDAMNKLAETCKARVEAYIGKLQDEDLAKPNPGLSARIGSNVPHVATLGMLASHTLYHIGSCDAALRNHGLKGVF